jgi:hypothetical protein
MDMPRSDGGGDRGIETPGAMLDELRDHPEWDERRRDEQLDRLVRQFPPEALIEAAWARFRDLRGPDGEAVLHLVEAFGTPEVYEALAEALIDQPALPLERAWEALALLDGAGMLEQWPELAGRWEELAEAFDEEGSLGELAAQIEEEPDGAWLALRGLGAVEPDVRAEIVSGLAARATGPSLVEFLRLLAFAHDPEARAAAIRALEAKDATNPEVAAAWASLAADHPDADVSARALRRLANRGGDALVPRARPAPSLERSLVTAVDGEGRAYIVLTADEAQGRAAAAFRCDVLGGIEDVVGEVGLDREDANSFIAEFASRPERDCVAGDDALALGLLAGSLLLCGPRASPALRYWLERTVGPAFRPRPFPGPPGESDPTALPPGEMPGRAREVLEACPGWVDDSDLTYELAEEILLREGAGPPDPRRDSGAFRYLFAQRIAGRLELYRRMLLWMAAFWHATGAGDLGRSALALAWELADAQHAVPGHPFTSALIARSLQVAQANLRRHVDLRNPEVRARMASGGVE